MPGYQSPIDPGPTSRFFSVTPSASKLPNGRCRGLYIGVGGDVAVTNHEGTTIVFKNMSEGDHAISTDTVLSSGTTATDIIALY